MARKRSAAQKLAGWGILAVVGLVIVGVFLISRGGAPSTPSSAAVADSPAVSSVAPASSQAASDAASASVSEAAGSAPSAAAESSSSSSSQSVAVVDATAMDQNARMAFLNKLIAQGVFTGVEAVGSPPKVGVTALFLGLNPDLQQQFVATVYAYVNNGGEGKEALQVIDATTGQVVGTYTRSDGLRRS